MSSPAHLSAARAKAASLALQYGHQEPRCNRITPNPPARSPGKWISPPPARAKVREGKTSPFCSITIVLPVCTVWRSKCRMILPRFLQRRLQTEQALVDRRRVLASSEEHTSELTSLMRISYAVLY